MMTVANGRWVPSRSMSESDRDWPISRLESLAYSVGVLLKGDGSVFESKVLGKGGCGGDAIRYHVKLRVKSRLFAETFRDRFARVLRRAPVKIHGPKAEDGCLVVRYTCVDFVRWWRAQFFASLKRIGERFPVAYLAGRYDSESSVGSYVVYMCGAEDHRNVLAHDRQLCIKLGIRAGKVKPYGRTGEPTRIGGREVRSKMQRLRFGVNASDFLRVIKVIHVVERNDKLYAMIKGRKWTPWGVEVRKRASKLRRTGLTPKETQTHLNSELKISVPYDTVYYWLKNLRSPAFMERC